MSEMSEMIERVAKAIWGEDNDDECRLAANYASVTFDEIWSSPHDYPYIRPRLEARARAAIKAMREPTNTMLDRADYDDIEWKANIDAALK
jgi:hypothetical protein